MPKRDRKARRDARRLEGELQQRDAEVARLRHENEEVVRLRHENVKLAALLETANQAVQRMSTHAFKLHLDRRDFGLADNQQYCLQMTLDRRMLDEMQMQGREYVVSLLADQIFLELHRAAREADRTRPLDRLVGGG